MLLVIDGITYQLCRFCVSVQHSLARPEDLRIHGIGMQLQGQVYYLCRSLIIVAHHGIILCHVGELVGIHIDGRTILPGSLVLRQNLLELRRFEIAKVIVLPHHFISIYYHSYFN